jgi:hypothetical protein
MLVKRRDNRIAPADGPQEMRLNHENSRAKLISESSRVGLVKRARIPLEIQEESGEWSSSSSDEDEKDSGAAFSKEASGHLTSKINDFDFRELRKRFCPTTPSTNRMQEIIRYFLDSAVLTFAISVSTI